MNLIVKLMHDVNEHFLKTVKNLLRKILRNIIWPYLAVF